MQGSAAAAIDASANGSSSTNGASTKRRGLLEAAMIPGLKDVDGDIAKLKHDLAVRADDITASSDAYRYALRFFLHAFSNFDSHTVQTIKRTTALLHSCMKNILSRYLQHKRGSCRHCCYRLDARLPLLL
jgi:hypothetical protein